MTTPMATKFDFAITCTPNTALNAARLALEAQGFDVSESPTDGLIAQRGNILSTLVFGSFAKNNIFAVVHARAFVDKQGRSILRISRNLFDDLANEKYFGTNELATQFDTTIKMLSLSLAKADLLSIPGP
jgi:hypothetical protein